MPGPILREYWTGNRAFWLVDFSYWPSDCLSLVIINNYWMRLSMISWIIKTEVSVICRSRRLRQITQTRGFDNSWYNIARALFLSKPYWAIMNKIFMYARPCSTKWREQFHFRCKISVEFDSASSFCLSFGNVKIILNNPNPTSSLWLLPGNEVYFNVSILPLFVSIFIERLYFVGYVFINKLNSKKRIFHWQF